jgi:YidC/Oxa1 family membrane protein insertase
MPMPPNQIRVFLILAWLMVATLLWMAWDKEQNPPPTRTSQAVETVDDSVPDADAVPAVGSVPSLPQASGNPAAPTAASPRTVTVRTDVLEVVLDGGEVRRADLLAYPSSAEDDSGPVRLFSNRPGDYFVAQSGWVSRAGAPSHESGFRLAGDAGDFTLEPGEEQVVVPFVWTGENGVTIRRTYTFGRGDYAVQVRDEVINRGAQPWQGFVYRQLARVPRPVEGGFMSPQQYSFQGAAWYSPQDKYEKREFEDFVDDGTLDKTVEGGWIAMLQHHFFAAWIPSQDATSTFSLAAPQTAAGTRYRIREVGPGVQVAPGGEAAVAARLWVGPKLVANIQSQDVAGLERAVDFSSFSIMATIAGWLFWVLAQLHDVFGNWGWAIVGLVVIIKLLMFPLSAAQYKSAAKMRRFQPRIAQLKERYGEDRQKFQQAMMELYKKEKINPVGGCLPILVQMPVFLALYWMLSESVELRHAPWILWIDDLTAPDPYFVLPAINLVLMWLTQKLTPTPGMDPMQQKMMQLMPLIFGVMFAFFPAGLVLYWATNSALGLLQQWWMLRKYGDAPVK